MKNKIQLLVDEANKEWGDGALILPELGGKMINEEVETITTGFPFLDEAIGVKGVPCGRITEIMGQEASGKSTLVLHLIKQAQQMGKRCALIDTEHSLDKERAIKIGVDFNALIISQPDSAEQALDLLDYLINSKQIGFVAIDSVAALVPKAELEGEMADANIGLQARLMGKILRKIVAPTNKYNVCVIFTNQVRAKLGGFSFIPQETTPGGNALKFYASLRIDIKKTGAKKKGDRLQYTTHKMTVKKNKLAPPLKVVEFNIDENGIRSDVINSDVI